MAPSQKLNLKDKVDEGKIDLSMCDLQDVPIKDIASIKNVYGLDISNNHLTQLPKNFSILIHLTKLDLSKNVLKELPENFGDLIKLKHLDLYKNELQHLPLSFSKLKALKWLDLKDNPLVPAIKDKAGPCLDSKQCQMCAKNIVQFYAEFQQKIEYEREIRDKQRQMDKQANELAAHKQKQQEKKSKKKEKMKSKENCVAAGDEITNINNKHNNYERISKQKGVKRTSFVWKSITLLFALLVLLSVGVFTLTSIKAKCTENMELQISTQWNHFIDKFPPSLKSFGNDFGHYFKNFHIMTGNGIYFLTNQLQEIQMKNSLINKIADFYHSLITTNKD